MAGRNYKTTVVEEQPTSSTHDICYNLRSRKHERSQKPAGTSKKSKMVLSPLTDGQKSYWHSNMAQHGSGLGSDTLGKWPYYTRSKPMTDDSKAKILRHTDGPLAAGKYIDQKKKIKTSQTFQPKSETTYQKYSSVMPDSSRNEMGKGLVHPVAGTSTAEDATLLLSDITEYIQREGRNSDKVKQRLKSLCREAEKMFFKDCDRVWVGYEPNKKDVPVFVAVVKERNVNAPKFLYGGKVVQRLHGEVSPEAKRAAKEEIKTKLKFSPDDLSRLAAWMKRNSEELLKKHSNLIAISASKIRSKGNYMSQDCCIVLYVHIKGIIPFYEDPFKLDSKEFSYDVREGLVHQLVKPDQPEHPIGHVVAVEEKYDAALIEIIKPLRHPLHGNCPNAICTEKGSTCTKMDEIIKAPSESLPPLAAPAEDQTNSIRRTHRKAGRKYNTTVVEDKTTVVKEQPTSSTHDIGYNLRRRKHKRSENPAGTSKKSKRVKSPLPDGQNIEKGTGTIGGMIVTRTTDTFKQEKPEELSTTGSTYIKMDDTFKASSESFPSHAAPAEDQTSNIRHTHRMAVEHLTSSTGYNFCKRNASPAGTSKKSKVLNHLQDVQGLHFKDVPTDKELVKITMGVGTEFRRLGLALGISGPRIEQLRMNSLDSRDQITSILLEWRKQKGQQATYGELKNALSLVESDGLHALNAIYNDKK